MVDAKYYFIYNIDVYQGNNKENIEIHPSLQKIPTTKKYVANYIINSGIANGPHGSRHIYMENQYAFIKLFSLMESNYNMREVVT